MEVGIIFKIGAVGILVSVLSLVLKHSGREDQAIFNQSCRACSGIVWVLPYIYDLFETVKKIICPVGRRGGWRYGNYPDRCGGYRLCTGCDLYENSKAGILGLSDNGGRTLYSGICGGKVQLSV